MGDNNPHRTSPRLSSSSSTSINTSDNGIKSRSSPTRVNGKRNRSNSSSFKDPNCVTTAAEILSKSELSNVNHHNGLHFYLQKLDLLYQNLEGRVQKLEHIFSDQIFGVDNGVFDNNNNPYNQMIHNHPKINNTNTASNTDNQFAFNSNTIIPSNCSSSSTSTISSILEPIQREINVNVKGERLLIPKLV